MERFKDNARLFAWLEWLGLTCAVGSFFALLLFNAWCLPLVLVLVATGLSLWLIWKRPTSVGCLALVIAIGVGLVGISFFVVLVLFFSEAGA